MMTDASATAILSKLQAFAEGQFDSGMTEVQTVVNRKQFDAIPALEEMNDGASAICLPYRKFWPMDRGMFEVLTDEPPTV
jgi:hypothetical protein